MTDHEDKLMTTGFWVGVAASVIFLGLVTAIAYGGFTPRQERMYNCVHLGGSVAACEAGVGAETDMSQCLAAGGNLGACWEAVD